jgi:hypothetical protein
MLQVVIRALERERRRTVATRDAEILARTDADRELAGLAEYSARLLRGTDNGRVSVDKGDVITDIGPD